MCEICVPRCRMLNVSRQAGKVEVYESRGVYVPYCLSPHEVMKAAEILEPQFDAAPISLVSWLAR